MIRKALTFLLVWVPCTHLVSQSPDDTVTIYLNAVGGLQYDLVRFKARPGIQVRVILANQDEMVHNLVFTQPGRRSIVVQTALDLGPEGPALNHIPESPDILEYLPVVAPGETDTIQFRAPRNTGVYPYVCTFPGHGTLMYGAMHVTNGIMPPIEYDMDVPPQRRESANEPPQATASGHPYEPVPPFLYRVLLPDAGPAAIAVSLPGGLSYCWDAGACRLRYAWKGGFLDLTDYWTIKGELHGKILGTVFYRDQTVFPLRITGLTKIPTVDFKGYRLIRGYPEFHYLLDDIEIFELIHPKKDGSGLIRTFRIPGAQTTTWFVHGPSDGTAYESTQGTWEENRLVLSPAEANEFTITMTISGGPEL